MASSVFNREQQQAIAHKSGPAMVIAGPGSGKTTVITNRVKRLIESGTAKPEEILVITFTVAAAKEMKERYLRQCRDANVVANYADVTFGTFHSVFYQFLRCIPGYEGLRLAEAVECIGLIKAIVQRVLPQDRDNGFTSDYYAYILNRISFIKNTEPISSAPLHSPESDLPHRLIGIYQQELLKRKLLDFDDMLVLFNKCLNENRSFRDSMRRRFRYIMIDEFQDINRIQFDAVRTLAAPLNNIFVVGDDDQSIYAFRGSDPSIMLSYKSYYPDAAFIELFTNYRSSKLIIKSASRLIAHNKDRYDKQFTAVKELKLPPAKRSFRTQAEEAAFIAQDIRRLPDEIKSVGILYRTHRTGSAVKQAIDKIEGTAVRLPEVRFMTFHASKGLEFDAVYIISANEGITPSKSTGKSGIEEERRLFYVAMTRAKYFLHISDTRYIYNKSQYRSRFVREAFGIIAAADDIFRNF